MRNCQRLTVEQVCERLGVDPRRGRPQDTGDADRRDASTRRARKPSEGILSCFASVAAEPTFVIFAIFVAVWAFFGEWRGAVLVAVVWLIFTSLFAAVRAASRAVFRRSCEKNAPQARVIRDGKVCRIPRGEVTVGDVLVFRAGDVIPADARLISAIKLKTLEKKLGDDGRWLSVSASKDAGALYSGSDEMQFYSNTVYASSAVLSGRGKAVAVAVGDETRGALLGFAADDGVAAELPPSLAQFTQKLRTASVASLAAIFPVVALAVWRARGGAELSLVQTCVTALAFAFTAGGEPTAVMAEHLLADAVAKSEKKVGVTPLPAKCDELARADFVAVMEERLLNDGQINVSAAYFDDRVCGGGEIYSPGFAECLSRLRLTAEALCDEAEDAHHRNDSLLRAVNAYCEQTGASLAYHAVRSREVRGDRFSADSFSAAIEFDTDPLGAANLFSITFGTSLLSSCVFYRAKDGEKRRLSAEVLGGIYRFIDEMRAKGNEVVLLISNDGAKPCAVFEGAFALDAVWEDCASGLLRLSELGADAVFVSTNADIIAAESAKKCGFAKDGATLRNFDTAGAQRGRERRQTVFLGLGKKEKRELALRAQKDGKNVCAVVGNISDLGVLPKGACSIACGENVQDAVRLRSAFYTDGFAKTSGRGGFGAVCEALYFARTYASRIAAFRDYVVFSVVLRLFSILIPLVAGETALVPTPVQVLAAGWLGDVAACAFALFFASPRRKGKVGKNAVVLAASGALGAAAAYFAAVALGIVCRGASVGAYFACVCVLQLVGAIFFSASRSVGGKS